MFWGNINYSHRISNGTLSRLDRKFFFYLFFKTLSLRLAMRRFDSEFSIWTTSPLKLGFLFHFYCFYIRTTLGNWTLSGLWPENMPVVSNFNRRNSKHFLSPAVPFHQLTTGLNESLFKCFVNLIMKYTECTGCGNVFLSLVSNFRMSTVRDFYSLFI